MANTQDGEIRPVIVVGLGSMGKRRVRLLKKLYPDIRIGGIDAQAERRSAAEEACGIETFPDIDTAVSNISPSAGFVCTSPLVHYPIIMQLLAYSLACIYRNQPSEQRI